MQRSRGATRRAMADMDFWEPSIKHWGMPSRSQLWPSTETPTAITARLSSQCNLWRPRVRCLVPRATRLAIVLVLNVVLVVGLVIVGMSAHSLGVVAAGGDYLADAAAIGVSLLAIALSRRPPTARRPHGYPKATAIAASTNGIFLLVVVALVMVEAVRRLVTVTHE